MRFRRSLRWKLLGWYALVVGGLAGLFGVLLFANVRRLTNSEVDARLRARSDGLAKVIIPLTGGKFQVDLAPDQVAYFGDEGLGASHYAIWTKDGRPVDESHPELAIPIPRSLDSRDRESFRELIQRGPGETWVLVGQDVRTQREQLRQLIALAVGAGVAATVLMLAGGWFLTGRALAPVSRISRAAASISASNLSERIDVARMEVELADLAGAINSAFDRLQAAFEQQTRFTADASHELRTPLSIVVAQADLALKQPRSAEDYREAVDAIRRAAQRMQGVVEGLLTLARADAGEIRMKQDELDLRDVVIDTCRLLEPLAGSHQVTLRQQLQSAHLRGDRDRLGEAVSNILVNAIRYNSRPGRVEVTLNGSANEVVLRIADSGRGIPDSQKDFVFERFFRSDQARNRSVDGSGLGLSITKWIVDAHGGTITCQDGATGGTVFELRIPKL
jgi:two-component system, OmpR family, sensor kinase